jgi:hypothetical protein
MNGCWLGFRWVYVVRPSGYWELMAVIIFTTRSAPEAKVLSCPLPLALACDFHLTAWS